jgi:hypothetical protein
MYAVSLKNIPITIGFVILTVAQLVTSIVMLVVTAKEGG